MDELRYILNNMTMDSYSGINLKSLLSLVQPFMTKKPISTRKADIINALYSFYTNIQSAEKLYIRLNAYEKALLHCIVQSKYNPLAVDFADIAKIHGVKIETRKSIYYYADINSLDSYYPKGSLLNAFYIKNAIPPLFKTYLEKVTPPYVRTFNPCEVDEDDYASIIGRDDRYKDFDALLRFVNSQNVPATKAGGLMNKTALLKFYSAAGLGESDDILAPDIHKINDIRNAGQTTVGYALAQLLRCADVLDIVKDKFVPSKNARKYSGLTMPEKAKFLFNEYINHTGDIIAECFRISSSKLKFSRSRHNLAPIRKEVISMLRECPVNAWIDFRKFSREMRKENIHLFYDVGEVMIRDDYDNSYYNEPNWESYEQCAISVMLMEYLATLGAVDVLAEDVTHSDYDAYSMYETSFFRITDLGAYLFGITDVYEEKTTAGLSGGDNGFIVQPNFDIVIPNGSERMRHELFFDRFADKTTDDGEVSVYKLNFKGMVKAVNIGINIDEIGEYCETFSNVPVPDNVKTALGEWEAQSGRIRIRTVTVIESDDALLLEEIKNYRGMDALAEERPASVLVLHPGAEKKAKTLIEKNKRFCVYGIS